MSEFVPVPSVVLGRLASLGVDADRVLRHAGIAPVALPRHAREAHGPRVLRFLAIARSRRREPRARHSHRHAGGAAPARRCVARGDSLGQPRRRALEVRALQARRLRGGGERRDDERRGAHSIPLGSRRRGAADDARRHDVRIARHARGARHRRSGDADPRRARAAPRGRVDAPPSVPLPDPVRRVGRSARAR